MQRKKNPVFNLQFTETFDHNQTHDDTNDLDLGDDDDLDQGMSENLET
jgi:hypothetical protein